MGIIKNLRCRFSQWQLRKAILTDNSDNVLRCLKASVSPNYYVGPKGMPLLSLAAMAGNLTIMRGLYAAGAVLDRKDAEGKTAGDWAKEFGHYGSWKMLVSEADSIRDRETFVCVPKKNIKRARREVIERAMQPMLTA
jgi:hypothetical protein